MARKQGLTLTDIVVAAAFLEHVLSVFFGMIGEPGRRRSGTRASDHTSTQSRRGFLLVFDGSRGRLFLENNTSFFLQQSQHEFPVSNWVCILVLLVLVLDELSSSFVFFVFFVDNQLLVKDILGQTAFQCTIHCGIARSFQNQNILERKLVRHFERMNVTVLWAQFKVMVLSTIVTDQHP